MTIVTYGTDDSNIYSLSYCQIYFIEFKLLTDYLLMQLQHHSTSLFQRCALTKLNWHEKLLSCCSFLCYLLSLLLNTPVSLRGIIITIHDTDPMDSVLLQEKIREELEKIQKAEEDFRIKVQEENRRKKVRYPLPVLAWIFQ